MGYIFKSVFMTWDDALCFFFLMKAQHLFCSSKFQNSEGNAKLSHASQQDKELAALPFLGKMWKYPRLAPAILLIWGLTLC